ncbi:hypothetical protein [uncultured Polaribacter sp.]|uniref:hypothetical protein n=1 Tax=uncultured Polaribacter sp. TaxID=174711 RepID=UPI002620CAF9|nr:hypothetical protein [uncultured Polaribacter sp.]
MRNIISKIAFTLILILSFTAVAQDNNQDDNSGASNIQIFTPSKLMAKGQWDIKFFNNLYTETKDLFGPNGAEQDILRQNFFTSTLDIFTGVSDSDRLNLGVLIEYRTNTIGGQSATSVFNFADNNQSRNGLSSFAPAIKWQPINGVGNFSVQSAFHIPLISEETDANGVFLDQTAYQFQNRFFYDYTLPGGDWQLFTELNTEYNFGEETSFANDTFVLAPGVFMSYFPSNKSTILAFAQHFQRLGLNDEAFTQDFTSLGLGAKYQLTDVYNLEILYSKFVRGTATGLGQSFNIGLRALF